MNVICELARKNPKNYLSLAPLFFKLMTGSTNNWMLIKIIKLVRCMFLLLCVILIDIKSRARGHAASTPPPSVLRGRHSQMEVEGWVGVQVLKLQNLTKPFCLPDSILFQLKPVKTNARVLCDWRLPVQTI